MTFADKVKAVRAKLMISQEELAKLIGVSRVTVTRWESQGFEPRLMTEQKFKTFCEKQGIVIKENNNG